LSNHSETIVSDGYLLDSSFLQKANTIPLSENKLDFLVLSL